MMHIFQAVWDAFMKQSGKHLLEKEVRKNKTDTLYFDNLSLLPSFHFFLLFFFFFNSNSELNI